MSIISVLGRLRQKGGGEFLSLNYIVNPRASRTSESEPVVKNVKPGCHTGSVRGREEAVKKPSG